jgi:hypothetical protein
MQRASRHHREDETHDASADQQQAIDDLERALEEIEQVLAQLREEEREELLAALEGRFREILERHRPITATTIDLEATRGQSEWTRADRLRLADIAREEHVLADLVALAHEILVEDGTTVIFPRIVSGLHDDMRNVHRRLADGRTGTYTQTLEKEIEQTLEELIEALERAQEEHQAQGEGQSSPSQPQNPPLVPNSAELKLLKSAQLRVNRRTEAFDEARPDAPLDAEMQNQVEKLESRQAEIVEMTEEMNERY